MCMCGRHKWYFVNTDQNQGPQLSNIHQEFMFCGKIHNRNASQEHNTDSTTLSRSPLTHTHTKSLTYYHTHIQ